MLCERGMCVVVLCALCFCAVAGSYCDGPAPQGGSTLLWHAPVSSANGFGNEAIEYITSLHTLVKKRNAARRAHNRSAVTRVCWVQHGDLPVHLDDALFADDVDVLSNLVALAPRKIAPLVVSVCHSTPPAWSLPATSAFDPYNPCPSAGVDSVAVVGRTMYESGSVPSDWAPRLAALDEAWVPTPFHVASFANYVAPEKMFLLPESIRTSQWSRPLRRRLPRRLTDYFFDGRSWPRLLSDLLEVDAVPSTWAAYWGDDSAEFGEHMLLSRLPSAQDRYRRSCSVIFLSVFKWERRKGIDVLLRAFLEEFEADAAKGTDQACLVLKAPEPQTEAVALFDDAEFTAQQAITDHACPAWKASESTAMLERFCRDDYASDDEFSHAGAESPPTQHDPFIRLVDRTMPMDLMPYLYAAADALVAPSRGEGWGRPAMEAMAVGTLVIATNWSGTAELISPYRGESVALALGFDVQRSADDGHEWAEPHVGHLREQMRFVVTQRETAKKLGVAGRRKVMDLYDAEKVAAAILERTERLLTFSIAAADARA